MYNFREIPLTALTFLRSPFLNTHRMLWICPSFPSFEMRRIKLFLSILADCPSRTSLSWIILYSFVGSSITLCCRTASMMMFRLRNCRYVSPFASSFFSGFFNFFSFLGDVSSGRTKPEVMDISMLAPSLWSIMLY